jgi:D-alanine-D-alanine ligase
VTGRRIRVAVVYGGRSNEHGVSVVSAGSVMSALDPEKYDVVSIGITRDGAWVLTEVDPEKLQVTGRSLPEVETGSAVVLPGDPTAARLVILEPGAGVRALDSVDVVFPVLHGRFGEDGTIQGLLEMAGVPYVGPGVLASAVAMDKEFAKKLLRAEGLPVGDYAVLRRGEAVSTIDLAPLGLPVFVKPARSGSSVGITKVRQAADLPAAVAEALRHDDKVLIEAAVLGREVECGVLESDDGRPAASVPAEIRLVGDHDWYDFEAKYLDDACEFDVPANLPADVTERVRELACRAFVALDCVGLARVDFFVGTDGHVVVNEVNTMPGFTPISMFPRMWAATGVDYSQLVDRLIATALRRRGGQ